MPSRQGASRGPAAACDCGLPPFVGVSRSAKNPGRTYSSCSRFPRDGHCSYFRWLDGWRPSQQVAAPPASPATPQRAEALRQPQPRPPVPAVGPRAGERANVTPGRQPDEAGSSELFAAFLVVVAAPPAQAALLLPAGTHRAQAEHEHVRLLLLPASAQPPAVCTQQLAVPTGEGRLPRAPVSLRSLQPPYVTVQHLPSARGLAAALGWPGSGAGGTAVAGGHFVLDCETTGLSGRDYIHQLALLNVATCQMLTLLLRTCPRTAGPLAAQACGASNLALHDPNRPTFGQAAALLHAFIAAGADDGGTAGAPAGRQAAAPLLVAHNGRFDASMLIAEWGRRGLEVQRGWRLLDTLPLARAGVAGSANHQQGTLRRHFGIGLAPGQAEHDAGTDVAVLAQLLPHLLRACGAPSLAPLLNCRVRKKSGESYVRTFGDVQDRMRGAAGQAEAAEAATFTCGFCHARVVH
ncbi:hypothetical protein ABPG75_000910 [Micractinium tetrahymenae]